MRDDCGALGTTWPESAYRAGAVWAAWSKEAVPRPVLWRQRWNEWVMPSEAGVGGNMTRDSVLRSDLWGQPWTKWAVPRPVI